MLSHKNWTRVALACLIAFTLLAGGLAWAKKPPRPPKVGLVVSPTEGLVTDEDGGFDLFDVSLKSAPSSTVVLDLVSSDTTEGVLGVDSLTFTTGNWSVPQTVLVTGEDDSLEDGNITYYIMVSVNQAQTTDPDYLALSSEIVECTNNDNDVEVYSSTDTPMDIIDCGRVSGEVPTYSYLSITPSDTLIKTLDLNASISHDRMSDLTATLISPAGTEGDVFYNGSTWELALPETFRGEALEGTWILEVVDNVWKKTGTLEGWSLGVTARNKDYIFKTEAGLTFQITVQSYGSDTPQPGVFMIHGGGFCFGGRFDIMESVTENMLDQGYIVTSVDYRLAPESKIVDSFQDIEDGYQWVLSEGPGTFNLDPNRVAVYGESAGAYYAQMAGFRLSPSPKAVVSFYGPNDFLGPFFMEPGLLWWEIDYDYALSLIGTEPLLGTVDFERKYVYGMFRHQARLHIEVTDLDPVADAAIYESLYCPLRNVTPNYPPTILVHGTEDHDVPVQESVNMADELTAQGVPRELHIVPGGGHVLNNGSADPADIEAAYQQVVNFLNLHVQ